MAKTPRKRKSWTEKFKAAPPFKVKPAPCDFAGIKAGQIMLVPSPDIIDARIRAIPPGKAMKMREFRSHLAAAHGAEVACPITTGVLMRVVAEAALEARDMGAQDLTPFWRVVDEASPLATKLSCGRAFLQEMRRAEGLA